jgi:hypothetical protein
MVEISLLSSFHKRKSKLLWQSSNSFPNSALEEERKCNVHLLTVPGPESKYRMERPWPPFSM